MKSAGELWLLCWLLFFFQWWELLGSSESMSLGTRDVVYTGNPWSSALSLDLSVRFSFASLWVGWTWSGSFMWCPERLRQLFVHPSFPFPVKGTLFSWGVRPWCRAVLGWVMKWCRANEAVLSFFVCLFSGVLFHSLAEVSLVDSWALQELFLLMAICLIVDLCWGDGDWGLLYHHHSDISLVRLILMSGWNLLATI